LYNYFILIKKERERREGGRKIKKRKEKKGEP
jgi:hypothetical protein